MISNIVLSDNIFFLSSQEKPFHGFLEILLNAHTFLIHGSQVVLSVRISLLSGL